MLLCQSKAEHLKAWASQVCLNMFSLLELCLSVALSLVLPLDGPWTYVADD